MPGRRPVWQPWAAIAGFSAMPHFAWEMLQAPLYRGMATAAHWPATLTCAAAAGGDAVITLAAYGAVAALVRDRAWGLAPAGAGRWRHLVAFVAVGEAITVGLELLNVHALGRWAYGDGMWTVAGVGAAPLAQWLLLPPLTIWLTRRHLA